MTRDTDMNMKSKHSLSLYNHATKVVTLRTDILQTIDFHIRKGKVHEQFWHLAKDDKTIVKMGEMKEKHRMKDHN